MSGLGFPPGDASGVEVADGRCPSVAPGQALGQPVLKVRKMRLAVNLRLLPRFRTSATSMRRPSVYARGRVMPPRTQGKAIGSSALGLLEGRQLGVEVALQAIDVRLHLVGVHARLGVLLLLLQVVGLEVHDVEVV